jgi:hypothetical protein
MTTIEDVKSFIDEAYANPERDDNTGKIDAAWVSLVRVKANTMLRSILIEGNNTDDINIDI